MTELERADDPELGLLTRTLETFKEEYGEAASNWRAIDGKAQGTIAVAGIFIAALAAYFRTYELPSDCGPRVFFAFVIALLLGSVVAAMMVLRVREVPGMPTGQDSLEIARDILRQPEDELALRRKAMVGDEITVWLECNTAHSTELQSKATALLWAQGLLAVAIIAIGLSSLVMLLVGV